VLACALALAAVGWAVESRTEVVSDVTRLVPQDLGAVRDVRALQRATGIAGEIDVLVQARDVTDARIVRWMTRYEHRALARFGYREARGCRAARLCPALSLPDLFSTRGAASSTTGVRRLLAAVPPYFSRAVVSGDRRAAALAFGIRLEPLAEQERVVDELRRRLHPPPGVSARLAGLPVLAADANARLADPWRRLGTLAAGLVAVALALATVFRSLRRALVPLVPIVLATGWSALVLFLTRVPLNPMSATLGVLVVAIATEFSVLLAERHRLERAAGLDLHAALRRTWRSTGAAVLASGVTAIAGFGVLVASDVAMLRDFGLVCVLDLAVALAGVLVVLPAVLVLAERPPERRPARRALAVRRPRRRATVA
jgi:predicted RND superfamily exporter protein